MEYAAVPFCEGRQGCSMTINTAEITRILDDARFAEIRRAMESAVVSREEFDRMEMPSGTTAGDVWRLVQVLRRQVGIVSIVPTFPEDEFRYVWYTLPRSCQRAVESILEQSAKEPSIGSLLSEDELIEAGMHSIIEEILAALEWSRKSSTYEHIRAVIKQENLPHCPEELLASNYYRILGDAFRGIEFAFDCMELYRGLVNGVEGVEGVEETGPINHDKVAVLQGFANKALQENDASKIYYSAHFSEFAMRYDPFGEQSALMGSLLRRLFFIKSGYPSLGLVSPMKTMLRLSDPKGISPLCAMHEDSTGISIDATGYYSKYIEAISNGLDEWEREVLRASDNRHATLSKIKKSDKLNYRQKQLLASFVERIHQNISVYDYKEEFQVAYSTARSDLSGLMKRGFLTILTLEGKSVIYGTCPQFEQKVNKLLD